MTALDVPGSVTVSKKKEKKAVAKYNVIILNRERLITRVYIFYITLFTVRKIWEQSLKKQLD